MQGQKSAALSTRLTWPGLKVVSTTAHGHSWGYIDCPVCAGRLYVHSTPRDQDNHARNIRRFIRKHEH